VASLLKKTEHYDKDERYMATSDLCEVLKRQGGSAEYHGAMDTTTERKICTAVLRLLHDKSNDVQAIAVKTLGILLTTVHQEQVLEIADSLANQVLDKNKGELRDVYAIGLRTLCKTVPIEMGDLVSQKLVTRLLEGLQSDQEEIVLACLDVLTDLLGRFGASSIHVTRQHEAILQLCLQQLSSDSHVVRKRAGNTIGCLSVVLSDALLVRMVESLLSQIEMAEGVGKSGRRRTRLAQKQAEAQKLKSKAGDTRALIRTMCTVSGAVGHRLGQEQIDRIVPIFLRFCDADDAVTGDDDLDDDDEMMEEAEEDETAIALANELRESCFTGFESFVSRCPAEVEPHLDQIVQAALAYMSYDPNYSYGDDDVEEVDEDDEYFEDDDNLEEEDQEDDDDDESWKVRRAAIRALAAVVKAKQHDPSMLWTKEFNVRKNKSSTVANALTARFKEREENCRVDVIDCTTNLLSVTVNAAKEGGITFATPDAMETDGVVIDLGTSYRPTLVKSCEKLLSIKKGGERSKTAALALLSTLCRAPGGVGDQEEIDSVFEHIRNLISAGQGDNGLHRDSLSKTLKLDALSLVNEMLASDKHNPVYIKRGIYNTLLADLCLSVKEHWYKVIAEALRVLSEVPRYFLTGYDGTEDPVERKQEMDHVATSIYTAIEPLLSAHDVDQEIKERALATCASLLSSLHTNLSKEQMDRLLTLVLERLRNETTRIAAIKTLSTVASSSGVDSMDNEDQVDLSLILGDSVSEMASFLKQQNRSLKQSSLEALDIVVTNHGSEDSSLADGQLFSTVLRELGELIVDSDLHLSHLALRVSISILKVCPACGPAVKEHVSTPALVLSTSPLLQDSALVSLLAFLEQMVISEAIDFQELLQLLRSRAETEERLSKLPLSSLAQSIAVITAATTPENREGVISDLLKSLEGASDAMDEASTRQMILSLRASGDLGRVVDYSSMDGVAERFQAVYLGSFDYSSEEIKHAGAYALGRAAMGAQAVLLPAIVDALEKNNQKKQYLLLSALREFIQCHLKTSGDAIVPSVPVILPHLINHCADEQESVRTMVADCLGALTCLQPAGMLVTLRDLIAEHSEIEAPGGHVAEGDEKSRVNALACWTALSSIKLAIAGKASASDLAAFMPDFLKLLDVEELSVRNAALLMVYSSVHHMPQLVSGMMSELIVPRLQEVSNLQLKKVVDLGPFKHTVDDALPLRKSALSIYATCLENLPGSLDIAAFMPVLAKALGDAEDVQLQAHQIVISMCQHHPEYLVMAADSFVEPLEKTINKKVGSKTGTELERANEWIKSGLRTTVALSKIEGVMNSPKFTDFVERTKKNTKFKTLLEALDS
jgi:cullin-associated NEDD8-dissociated protein 1